MYKKYIIPYVVLFGGMVISWTFYYKISPTNQELALTLSLSTIGIFFGLFQVLLSNTIQKIKNINELRYAEYKSTSDLLTSISEILNENMSHEINVYPLVNIIMNRFNRLIDFNKYNNDYLFKGILDDPITNKLLKETKSILIRTDVLRKEIEDLHKKDREINELEVIVLEMNWHNDIRDSLKVFNQLRSEYVKVLQSYFK